MDNVGAVDCHWRIDPLGIASGKRQADGEFGVFARDHVRIESPDRAKICDPHQHDRGLPRRNGSRF